VGVKIRMGFSTLKYLKYCYQLSFDSSITEQASLASLLYSSVWEVLKMNRSQNAVMGFSVFPSTYRQMPE
jgi:hypothetical protein